MTLHEPNPSCSGCFDLYNNASKESLWMISYIKTWKFSVLMESCPVSGWWRERWRGHPKLSMGKPWVCGHVDTGCLLAQANATMQMKQHYIKPKKPKRTKIKITFIFIFIYFCKEFRFRSSSAQPSEFVCLLVVCVQCWMSTISCWRFLQECQQFWIPVKSWLCPAFYQESRPTCTHRKGLTLQFFFHADFFKGSWHFDWVFSVWLFLKLCIVQ